MSIQYVLIKFIQDTYWRARNVFIELYLEINIDDIDLSVVETSEVTEASEATEATEEKQEDHDMQL